MTLRDNDLLQDLERRVSSIEEQFDENVLNLYGDLKILRTKVNKLRSLKEIEMTRNEKRVFNSCVEKDLVHGADFEFIRVKPDYYDRSLFERAKELGALSIHHLCKSLLYKASFTTCSKDTQSKHKFVLIMSQYTCEVEIDLLERHLTKMYGTRVILRFANEDETKDIACFEHNALAPIGLRKENEVLMIMAESLFNFVPNEFYLGAGEVNTKLKINDVFKFQKAVKAYRLEFSKIIST